MTNYNNIKSAITHNIKEQVNDKEAISNTINPVCPYTKIDLTYNNSTSFNSGDIFIIAHEEMLPCDTFDVELGAMIRTSMPKASTWEIALLEITAFFVPNRYIWLDWVHFMGEPKTYGSPRLPEKVPTLKSITFNLLSEFMNQPEPKKMVYPTERDYLSHLGVPIGCFEKVLTNNQDTTIKYTINVNEPINLLPLYGLGKIYNDWYRNEFYVDAIQIPTLIPGATNFDLEVNKDGSNNFLPNSPALGYGFFKSSKLDDYFTTCLPSSQVGDSVKLQTINWNEIILNNVPVHDAGSGPTSPGNQLTLYDSHGAPSSKKNIVLGLDNDNVYGRIKAVPMALVPGASDAYFRLETDSGQGYLSSPGGDSFISVDDLRKSLSLQHYREVNQRSGLRYIEQLKGHFGVSNNNIEFGYSEIIYSFTVDIATQNVIQTSSTTSTSPLGTIGGIGMNSGYVKLPSYTAKEHGQFYILGTVRPVNNYPFGLPKKLSHIKKEDFYTPEFDRLGEQPVRKKEIFFKDGAATNNQVFGYQIAWGEYKYSFNKLNGIFHPRARNSIGKLYKYFENYDAAPTANKAFMEQNEYTIGETLLINGGTYEFGVWQYVGFFNIKLNAIRPMTYNAVPGLTRV